jgi:drug efflux transport system permease protein
MAQRIFSLMRKEFLALLRDKKSRVVVFVPPILQVLVFGYAATFDLKNIPYAVFNEDSSGISRELEAGFHGSPHFQEITRIGNQGEIAPLIDRREVLLVLHIGPRFRRDLTLGRPAVVQVIVDGRNSNTAMLALNYTKTVINAFNERLREHGGTAGPPARLETRAWFNPNLESRWFIVPGIVGLLTLVVTILVTSLSVAREREQGTFDQLLVTPFRPVEILIGKALPGFLIGIAEATVIILVTVFWFRVPLLGSIVTLYTGVVLFLFSAIGVGLMISSLSVTQQQGLLGAFLFVVPAVILSGFTTPIANMPPLVQDITLVNPMRYFMVVLRGVFLQGTPFSMLLGQFWPMAAIGLCTLALAGWMFRHRLY